MIRPRFLCIRREPNQGANAYDVVDEYDLDQVSTTFNSYLAEYGNDDKSGTEVLIVDWITRQVYAWTIMRDPAPIRPVFMPVRQLPQEEV